MPIPSNITFSTSDGGVVHALEYGAGERAVVLAHGLRFNKESWAKQADVIADAGFRVVAIDFRGYGESRGGTEFGNAQEAMHLDIVAAARYLRVTGATSVAAVGGSMGARAAANAVIEGQSGEIDRLVLIAPPPIEKPQRITGPKLFAVSEGDPLAATVREQFGRAPDPKELLVLGGSAHAQFLFDTDEGGRLMAEILRFVVSTP